MQLKVTPLMKQLLNNKKSIIVFQGSSGSSKTYSILQFIIIKCLSEWENKTIDIVRRTYPSLRISVMKDFFDILKSLNLYSKENHNKSESSYNLGGNTIRFYSSDDEQKVRGPRRDIVFFNEILEFKRIDVMQIMMRTREFIFMDYNPSEEFHWLYDEILPRDDVFFLKSTYKDNPFLEEKVVKEIERLKEVDKNLWRIYGLGERGVTQATIYSNWDYADKTFKDFEGQIFYGLDFGFNDPTALVRVKYHKSGIYAEELLYKTNLTSDEIVKSLENLENKGLIKKDDTIYADSARPEIIEDIKRAGFNVHPVKKEQDSILRGINFIKKHNLFINKNSLNLIKELKTYKWKVDKDDKILDVPVDLNDHLLDALRYALSSVSKYQGKAGILSGGAEIFG